MLFGSSPLARGTYRNLTLGHNVTRLIPARAGNISSITKTVSPRSAHPRSRGEHAAMCPRVGVAFGSSPLARGTLPAFPGIPASRRLIPARAGNIHSLQPAPPRPSAHPRSRGEHWRKTAIHELANGSSPLARGTYTANKLKNTRARLIPARAGNIPTDPTSVLNAAAHPRSRGEHSLISCLSASGAGSSPLARGTSQSRENSFRVFRLIPARAGNIITLDVAKNVTPAHPRSRGEHFSFKKGAGCSPAHPRSRGEHEPSKSKITDHSGSSPLARGTCDRTK